MASFTVHRITADYRYSDNTVVGEGWIRECVWEAQDLIDKLRATRPELYNFKITSSTYGSDR